MYGNKVSPLAQAAGYYALAIRGKRDLLQTLFYATRNSAAEAWALHRRLTNVEQRFDDGSVSVSAGDIMPRIELVNAKTAAEATAQDSAWALVLIVDYSLQRFRMAASSIDSRTIGADIRNGVKLNAAIWALANQARHLHAWSAAELDGLESREEVAIIRSLRLDPLDPNAARELLCVSDIASYVGLEDMLLETAREALIGTGYSLGMLSAGTYRLDPIRDPTGSNS